MTIQYKFFTIPLKVKGDVHKKLRNIYVYGVIEFLMDVPVVHGCPVVAVAA